MKDYQRIENDKSEEKLLDFKWVTPEELKDIDLRPSNIKDMIINGEYLKGLLHYCKKRMNEYSKAMKLHLYILKVM